MSRLRRIETSGRFFFVTTNLQRGVAVLDADERILCLQHIDRARSKHGFSLFAYVIMPNHIHLLLGVFRSSLPALMADWKRSSALSIQESRKVRGAVWQPRYFDFILRRAADFAEKFDYIHQNPVAAGLVSKPEDWACSSYCYYAKKDCVPVVPNEFDVPLNANEPLWPASWR